MTTQKRHIIHKQVLDLTLPSEKGAYRQQRSIGTLYKEQVLPLLGQIFDQLNDGSEVIQLARLEVDLGNIPPGNLDREFVQKCVKAIHNEVAKKVQAITTAPESSYRIISREQQFSESFFYFLQTGLIPPLLYQLDWTAFEVQILHSLEERSEAIRELLTVASANPPKIIRRLLQQFSPSFIDGFLNIIWQAKAVSLGKYLQAYNVATGRPTESGTEEVIKLLKNWRRGDLPPKMSQEERRGVLTLLLQTVDSEVAPMSEAALPTDQPNAIPAYNGLYIDCAGLILLHPFLPMFFRELGLVEESAFHNRKCQERGVHLLYHLASGACRPAEHLLPLAKLLCGLAFEEPVAKKINLKTKEKKEARELLVAVIRHWKALKNTSPDGLRQGFLLRSGKLQYQKKRDCWLLQVERKGQDSLLEKLPWAYATIKLPWMERRLQVEW